MADPDTTVDFTIRRTRITDHQRLCKLWRQVDAFHARIRPDFFSLNQTYQPARSRRYLDRIVNDPDQEIFVAVVASTEETVAAPPWDPDVGEGLVGLIHVQLYDTPRAPVFVDRRRAHVDDLVVDASMRRRGIGTALLEAGENWAVQRNAGQLVLTVWVGNEAADGFYAAHGYHQASRVLAKEL